MHKKARTIQESWLELVIKREQIDMDAMDRKANIAARYLERRTESFNEKDPRIQEEIKPLRRDLRKFKDQYALVRKKGHKATLSDLRKLHRLFEEVELGLGNLCFAENRDLMDRLLSTS